MNESAPLKLLPEPVGRTLTDFVDATTRVLASDLRSIVLFGSAAEARLRKTSDVNLLVLARRFEADKLAALRGPFRVAAAAIRLRVMYLLESELEAAAQLFAVKFSDIQRRHVTLYGADIVSELRISRDAEIARLRQVLLNLSLRIREAFASDSEERFAQVLAEVAGPLRVSAQTMVELQGKTASSPKEALSVVAGDLSPGSGLLAQLSAAREAGELPPAAGPKALLDALTLLESMRVEAEKLR